MTDIPLGLAYDDVLIVPARSRIASRAQIDTSSSFTPRITLQVPIVSANMDTVTTAPMSIAMAKLGGIGVIHRFLSSADQAREVEKVKRHLGHVILDPYSVTANQTVAEARAEAQAHNVTGLVVTDDSRQLMGLLTARDLRSASDEDLVDDAMTPQDRLIVGRPGISLEEARELMHKHRIEKVPLVEEDGVLRGLITLRDIALTERFPRSSRDDEGRLLVAAAVGVNEDYASRAKALVAAEVDALVVDIAHGHSERAMVATRELKDMFPEVEVVVGNVATAQGVKDLADAGADSVKVGIGPGFACTTRLVAGVGVPQFSAVLECAAAARDLGVPLIADGGIRRPSDVSKAIAAGASTVMIGSLLAGREEAPGEVIVRAGRKFKVFRGMASRAAAAVKLDLAGRADALDQYVPEGEEMEFPLRGPVAEVVSEMVGGLRSGMSYADAATVSEFWERARFVRQTEAGRRESKPGTPGES